MQLKQIYTSVACNRTPEIADWNNNDIMCYGASNAVIIYDTNIKGRNPVTVLSHHKSKINSVKWLHKPDGTCSEFLSCSADKSAAVWTCLEGTWEVTSTLTGHNDGVTCIHGLYTNENELVVFTGSIDSTVRIWERTNGIVSHKQTINLNSGLCLTLHTCTLTKDNQLILFCALDDHRIHIFAKDEEFHRVHMLIGHEDWVRGLDTLQMDKDTIMLASASQDTYIRLWRIQKHMDLPSKGIKVEQKVFTAYNVDWSVKLDAVLAGHEGWVYGVQWQEYCKDSNKHPNYRILSSSLDKTLIIWEPECEGGVWVEKVRVGEVGGNGLGFYGSRFGNNAIMGHGYNGSLHIWRHNKETNQWQPTVVVGGHFSGVEDVRWENQGRYLLSVSLDQTTRLHAPWNTGYGSEWHEIARPQVHGYDMSSVALVSPTVFASAAEEKVIRVFTAPHNFTHNYMNIVGEKLVDDDVKGPEGACVPSLGLSNKAVFSGEDQATTEQDNDGYFTPVDLHEPPTEETLMQNTLWPESHKAYGHGYEVQCLAAAARRLASAARATTREHAAILLWETENWQQVQKLVSHQLTVTQLAFSHDAQRLLSVSRDRKWSVFELDRESNQFTLAACSDKTNGVHTRIIWCCAWSHDDRMFGTGSRDGKVCVWSKADTPSDTSLKDYCLYGKPLEVGESVTALDFAPSGFATWELVAVGLESGLIRLYRFDGCWDLLAELDHSAAHHLTVKRLTFRPTSGDSRELWLASCGSDHLVRIYTILL